MRTSQSRAEQKVENQFLKSMWKKKDEGGFKPLWVKCQCGKWCAVQPGAVLKYLEKIVAPRTATPAPEKPAEAHE
jgi:hypothetical protein